MLTLGTAPRKGTKCRKPNVRKHRKPNFTMHGYEKASFTRGHRQTENMKYECVRAPHEQDNKGSNISKLALSIITVDITNAITYVRLTFKRVHP
jgi:hypothetical protein